MTQTCENVHRQRKRQLEMEAITRVLAPILNNADGAAASVLEFGAGDGFQVSYLRQLGRVTALDLEISQSLKSLPDIETVACNIANTPFSNNSFNLIFSNHVIEHLEDLPGAFRELHRIGSFDCVYAFSVPTNFWLLLSVPAQYWSRLRRIFNKKTVPGNNGKNFTSERNSRRKRSFADALMPRGHGVDENFLTCYRQFKIESWQSLFTQYGFEVLKIQPLLLYGPSECPIIPTISALRTRGLCSSVLFTMKKAPTQSRPAA